MPEKVRFASFILDRFIAPNVSQFKRAAIPDIGDIYSFWMGKHFLNSVLRGSYPDPYRQYVLNYIRRVHGAHESHKLARGATESYLSGPNHYIAGYMQAILHWESFLAQSWMAYSVLQPLTDGLIYSKGDGSIQERLNHLYNRSKHAENVIKGRHLPEGGAIPVWMENDGLHGNGVLLKWEETGLVLEELSSEATLLEDPRTLLEKLESKNKVP